jgi:hypothetical protein
VINKFTSYLQTQNFELWWKDIFPPAKTFNRSELNYKPPIAAGFQDLQISPPEISSKIFGNIFLEQYQCLNIHLISIGLAVASSG